LFIKLDRPKPNNNITVYNELVFEPDLRYPVDANTFCTYLDQNHVQIRIDISWIPILVDRLNLYQIDCTILRFMFISIYQIQYNSANMALLYFIDG